MEIKLSDEQLGHLIQLFETVRDRQFAIGDYLIELVKTGYENLGGGYDEMKQAVINYAAGSLRVKPSTLYDYYRVSAVWDETSRQEFQALEWTVYRNSNPYDPIDRAILERVIDEQLTATQFREIKYPTLRDPKTLLGRAMGMLKKISKMIHPEASDIVNQAIEQLQLIQYKVYPLDTIDGFDRP